MVVIHVKLLVKNVLQVLLNVLHVTLECIRVELDLVPLVCIVHPHALYVMIKIHVLLVHLDTLLRLVIINVINVKFLV